MLYIRIERILHGINILNKQQSKNSQMSSRPRFGQGESDRKGTNFFVHGISIHIQPWPAEQRGAGSAGGFQARRPSDRGLDGQVGSPNMIYSLQKPLNAGGVITARPLRRMPQIFLPKGRSVPEFKEEEILGRASQGDREAFGLLYEQYVARIFNYVYYRTGNVHDAEDLTARVFYRALHHIQSYTNRGLPFSAWLYRIAHNLIANWHRDRSRHREIPLDDTPSIQYKGEPPEMALMLSQNREALLRLIRHLPSDRQHLLILKFVEHISNAEVGQIMGRSEGAVKSLYHRTLLELRDQMMGEDLEGD